jgi:hypothetical protein
MLVRADNVAVVEKDQEPIPLPVEVPQALPSGVFGGIAALCRSSPFTRYRSAPEAEIVGDPHVVILRGTPRRTIHGEKAPPDDEKAPSDGQKAPPDDEKAPSDGQKAPPDDEKAPWRSEGATGC